MRSRVRQYASPYNLITKKLYIYPYFSPFSFISSNSVAALFSHLSSLVGCDIVAALPQKLQAREEARVLSTLKLCCLLFL